MNSAVEHSVDVARTLNDELRLSNIAFASLEAHVTSFGEPPFKFAMKLGTVYWSLVEGQLLAFYSVDVAVQDSSPEKLAKLSVVARATYALAKELDDEHSKAIPAYLGIAGWMQIWPYVRAEMQELSMKLGLPPLTLPVLLSGQTRNVPVKRADEETSEHTESLGE